MLTFKKTEESPYVWVGGKGESWSPNKLTVVLKRDFDDRFRTAMSITIWRHAPRALDQLTQEGFECDVKRNALISLVWIAIFENILLPRAQQLCARGLGFADKNVWREKTSSLFTHLC